MSRTAAEITAAAVFELFPDVKLWGGEGTAVGFSYDLFFPHPINPDTMALIEEKMRQIVREKRQIRTLEMVPFSARELLKAQGHHARAQELEGSGLVELIQIGSFYDLSQGPHLQNTAELAAFKLRMIEPLEGKGIRIWGSAASSKQELKIFLKKIETYSTQNHVALGEKFQLWTELEEGIVWLPRGLALREKIMALLKKNLFHEVLEVSGVPTHSSLAKKLGKFPIRLGELKVITNDAPDLESALFEASAETQIQISSFFLVDQFEAELNSSLQSIGKTLIILGFKSCVKVSGRKHSEKPIQTILNAFEALSLVGEFEAREGQTWQVDFLIEDGLGRKWPALSLSQIDTRAASGLAKNSPLAGFFLTASVEKISALLVERYLVEMNCEQLMRRLDQMVQL